MSSVISFISSLYRKQLGKRLARYGLKYEDLLAESDHVDLAVSWLSNEEKQARDRRMVRAADCSFKRTYLPDEIQKIQQPFDFYLDNNLKEAKAMLDERKELSKW